MYVKDLDEGLTWQEAASLWYYSKNGYKGLNGDLYAGNKLSEFRIEFKKSLENALKKLPETGPTALYRGAILDNHFLIPYQKRAIVTHKAFTSTSDDRGCAMKFTMEKDIPKNSEKVIYELIGSSGKCIDKYSHWAVVKKESEHEYLFLPDTKFRVIKQYYNRKLNIVHIIMKEL